MRFEFNLEFLGAGIFFENFQYKTIFVPKHRREIGAPPAVSFDANSVQMNSMFCYRHLFSLTSSIYECFVRIMECVRPAPTIFHCGLLVYHEELLSIAKEDMNCRVYWMSLPYVFMTGPLMARDAKT